MADNELLNSIIASRRLHARARPLYENGRQVDPLQEMVQATATLARSTAEQQGTIQRAESLRDAVVAQQKMELEAQKEARKEAIKDQRKQGLDLLRSIGLDDPDLAEQMAAEARAQGRGSEALALLESAAKGRKALDGGGKKSARSAMRSMVPFEDWAKANGVTVDPNDRVGLAHAFGIGEGAPPPGTYLGDVTQSLDPGVQQDVITRMRAGFVDQVGPLSDLERRQLGAFDKNLLENFITRAGGSAAQLPAQLVSDVAAVMNLAGTNFDIDPTQLPVLGALYNVGEEQKQLISGEAREFLSGLAAAADAGDVEAALKLVAANPIQATAVLGGDLVGQMAVGGGALKLGTAAVRHGAGALSRTATRKLAPLDDVAKELGITTTRAPVFAGQGTGARVANKLVDPLRSPGSAGALLAPGMAAAAEVGQQARAELNALSDADFMRRFPEARQQGREAVTRAQVDSATRQGVALYGASSVLAAPLSAELSLIRGARALRGGVRPPAAGTPPVATAPAAAAEAVSSAATPPGLVRQGVSLSGRGLRGAGRAAVPFVRGGAGETAQEFGEAFGERAIQAGATETPFDPSLAIRQAAAESIAAFPLGGVARGVEVGAEALAGRRAPTDAAIPSPDGANVPPPGGGPVGAQLDLFAGTEAAPSAFDQGFAPDAPLEGGPQAGPRTASEVAALRAQEREAASATRSAEATAAGQLSIEDAILQNEEQAAQATVRRANAALRRANADLMAAQETGDARLIARARKLRDSLILAHPDRIVNEDGSVEIPGDHLTDSTAEVASTSVERVQAALGGENVLLLPEDGGALGHMLLILDEQVASEQEGGGSQSRIAAPNGPQEQKRARIEAVIEANKQSVGTADVLREQAQARREALPAQERARQDQARGQQIDLFAGTEAAPLAGAAQPGGAAAVDQGAPLAPEAATAPQGRQGELDLVDPDRADELDAQRRSVEAGREAVAAADREVQFQQANLLAAEEAGDTTAVEVARGLLDDAINNHPGRIDNEDGTSEVIGVPPASTPSSSADRLTAAAQGNNTILLPADAERTGDLLVQFDELAKGRRQDGTATRTSSQVAGDEVMAQRKKNLEAAVRANKEILGVKSAAELRRQAKERQKAREQATQEEAQQDRLLAQEAAARAARQRAAPAESRPLGTGIPAAQAGQAALDFGGNEQLELDLGSEPAQQPLPLGEPEVATAPAPEAAPSAQRQLPLEPLQQDAMAVVRGQATPEQASRILGTKPLTPREAARKIAAALGHTLREESDTPTLRRMLVTLKTPRADAVKGTYRPTAIAGAFNQLRAQRDLGLDPQQIAADGDVAVAATDALAKDITSLLGELESVSPDAVPDVNINEPGTENAPATPPPEIGPVEAQAGDTAAVDQQRTRVNQLLARKAQADADLAAVDRLRSRNPASPRANDQREAAVREQRSAEIDLLREEGVLEEMREDLQDELRGVPPPKPLGAAASPEQKVAAESAETHSGTTNAKHSDRGRAYGHTRATLDRIAATARRTFEQLNLNSGEFEIVDTPEGIPGLENVAPNTQARYSNGRVYIFSDRIADEAEAQRIAVHEAVVHGGIEALLGTDERVTFLDAVYQGNDRIRSDADRILADRKEAAEAKKTDADRAKDAKKTDAAKAAEAKKARLDAIEEAVAQYAEQSRAGLAPIGQWESFMAFIRNLLRRIGFKVKVSDQDVDAIVDGLRRYVSEYGLAVRQNRTPSKFGLLLSQDLNLPRNLSRWFQDSRRDVLNLMADVRSKWDSTYKPKLAAMTADTVIGGKGKTKIKLSDVLSREEIAALPNLTMDQIDLYQLNTLERGNVEKIILLEVKPITDQIDDLVTRYKQATGLDKEHTLRELHDYLTALHAKERNRTAYRLRVPMTSAEATQKRADILSAYYAREISRSETMQRLDDLLADNAKYAFDPRAGDASAGWSNKSGMSDIVADGILNDLRAKPGGSLLPQLSAKVAELNAKAIELNTRGRRWTPQAQLAKELYGWNNYVPLKGDDPISAPDDAFWTLRATDRGNLAEQFEGMKGRHTESDNVLAQVIADANQAARRAAQLDTSMGVLYNALAGTFGDSAPTMKLLEPGEIVSSHISDTILVPVGATDEAGRMTGRILALEFPTGNKYSKAIKGNNVKNIVALDKTMGRGTSFFGRLFTKYSANFWPVALFREAVQSATITGVEWGLDVVPEIVTRGLTYLPKLGRFLPHFYRADVDAMNRLASEDRDYADIRDYLMAGGKISYISGITNDQQLDRLTKLTGNQLLAAARKGDLLFDYINDALDMSSRMAVFSHGVHKRGMSVKEAAAYAKNLANFETTGEFGRLLGAFYVFFRPGATGVVRSIDALMKNPEKAPAVLGFLTGLGVMAYAMSVLTSGEDDYGDNKTEADSMNRWVRQARFFPGDMDNPIQIKYGYGLGGFMAFGAQIAALLAGHQGFSAFARNTTQIATENFLPLQPSYVPIDQTTIFLGDTIMPSIIAPIFQIAWNRDDFGNPINRDETSLRGLPEALAPLGQTRDSVYSDLTEIIFRETGISLSPNTIKHVTETYASPIVQVMSAMGAWVDPDAAVRDMIPGLKGFQGKEVARQTRFYQSRENVERLYARYTYLQDVDRPAASAMLAEYPGLLAAREAMNAANGELRKLGDARREAYKILDPVGRKAATTQVNDRAKQYRERVSRNPYVAQFIPNE